jgi:cytochrome c oxidase cbb3-type subunit I
MSDQLSSSTPVPATIPATGLVPTDQDLSCRVPVLFLFVAGAIWLIVASFFGFLASLKFHSPAIMSESAWATYGRIYPVSMNSLLYGFGIQAALAATLWIFCRLGQTRLVGGGIAILGGILLNIGLTIGVIAVLLGYNTGYQWLEFPRGAAILFFFGYGMIGISALLTFHNRLERELYPSQWFLVGGLFWFAWIYSSANLLLNVFQLRGVVQATTNWWYMNNLLWIYLALVGLAVIFYLLPKLLRRPLYSRNLAQFAFWTLIFFGSWMGIHHGAPVPAWLPGVSTVMTIFLVLPLAAIAMMLYSTAGKSLASFRIEPALKFAGFAAVAFLVAYTLKIFGALRPVNEITHFTYFTTAQNHLVIYAFFSMALFSAIYYIIPHLAGREWPSRRMVNVHFILAALGVLLYAVPLLIGGVVQGLALNNAQVPFMHSVSASVMFFRLATVGETLIVIGHLILLMNIARILFQCCRECCFPAETAAETTSQTAEVRP